MSIRNLPKNFRFAILALLAAFSSFSASAVTLYFQSTLYPGHYFQDTATACSVITAAKGWTYRGFTPSLECDVFNPATANFVLSTTTIPPACSPSTYVWGTDGNCHDPAACPTGQTLNTTTNECAWPTSCPSGQVLFTQTNSFGSVASASCVPQVATPTQKCLSYDDMQTSFCQQQSATCSGSGGTFGSVGAGSTANNVCIPAGNNLPTCASGGSQFITNSDGSSTPSCVGSPNISPPTPAGVTKGDTSATTVAQSGADTANNTAAIAAISQQGFAAVVNALNNNTAKTVAAGGGSGTGSTAAQDNSNAQGIIDAVNANATSEKGANQCDPHKNDYAKCIGQTADASGPASDPSTFWSGYSDQTISVLNGSADSFKTSLDGGDTPDGPSFVDGIKTSMGFDSPGACNDYIMDFHYITVPLSCEKTAIFRAWEAFALGFMTLYTCIQIALTGKHD